MAKRRTSEAQRRYEICRACPAKKFDFCKDCRCFIPAKVMFPGETCPRKKW